LGLEAQQLDPRQRAGLLGDVVLAAEEGDKLPDQPGVVGCE